MAIVGAGRFRVIAAASLWSAAIGCAMPKLPGESVGSYRIEGALTLNECGQDALPAVDPLEFMVDIRRDDNAGYWLQGAPPARAGKLADSGAFSFELESSYVVDTRGHEPLEGLITMDPEAAADPSSYEKLYQPAGDGSCQLIVTETVAGELLRRRTDASADSGDGNSPDLIADNVIEIRSDVGASCRLLTQAQGGPFEKLPCQAHYDFTGTLLDAQ